MRSKRVLITGGLGFIGSNLAHRLLKLGAEVAIYDSLNPNSGGSMYNVNDVMDSIELCQHSILDFDQLCKCIQDRDFVINCAASTSHPLSMKEPRIDLDTNGLGVINLLEALRRSNPEARLVHLGTSSQFGRLLYRPADENHPEFPTDIYSANKSVSEKYVLVYASAHGVRGTVLRLSNVFGPRAAIHSPDFTFNNYFIGLALQGKPISIFGDGKQLRNVLYVDDAVSAIVLSLLAEVTKGLTFLAVGDNHYSVAQIAEATVQQIGNGTVEFVDWPDDRKSIEIGDMIVTNQKFKDAVGWVPAHDLEDGLSLTNAYYQSCLQEYLK